MFSRFNMFMAFSLIFLLSASALAQNNVVASLATSNNTDPRAIVVERVIKNDYQTVLNNVRQQLKDDGWKLIEEINLGKRLSKKGVDVPGGLVIFKLTSGKNSMPLLAKDETRYISAMMPCGLSVYGKRNGEVVISRMNFEMLGPMMEPEVSAVMKKSIAKLNKTIDTVIANL